MSKMSTSLVVLSRSSSFLTCSAVVEVEGPEPSVEPSTSSRKAMVRPASRVIPDWPRYLSVQSPGASCNAARADLLPLPAHAPNVTL